MDKETGKSRRKKIAISAAVLIPVMLILGLHLFVRYKAKLLLPALVSRMSDGKYTLSSRKFTFHYFKPSIGLIDVHLRPAVEGLDEEYHVRIDTFNLSIESILPIFFNEAINVNNIRLVNPAVLIKRNKRMEVKNDDAEINVKITSLQNNAIRFLNELSVNECSLVNGSFRFYPFPGSDRQFNIEHLNLEIRDVVIPPYQGEQSASIDGKIKLSIRDPRLRIPDSLLDVRLDNFVWDNQERFLNVGNFMISQRSMAPRADSFLIALDTIRVRGINWNTWLDSGILKIDTVIAKNGDMYFESSAVKVKRRAGDSMTLKKLKVWDAIGNLNINYFSARYINAAIINRNPGHERSNTVMGDSLIIRDLAVRPLHKDPLVIRDLGLGVREFLDRGTNNKYQSSFSRMQLKGDTMVLNNYLVQSTPQSRLGKGSSLLIPTLVIEGLSFQDLMDEKASVREVRMEHPQLLLFANIKGDDGNGLKLSKRTLDEIRPYVDVEKMILNDASVTVNSKTEKGLSLGTRQFSAIILSRAAMSAQDMDGFLSNFRNVNLKQFYLHTPRSQLELFDGAVDYSNKNLHFNRIVGFINNKRIHADLSSVDLQGASELRPFDRDVLWHFRKLSADSGSLEIALDSSTAVLNNRDPDKMIGMFDSLDLSDINIKVTKKDMAAAAYITRAQIQGHHVYPAKYDWDDAALSVKGLTVKSGGFSFASRAAELRSRGQSVLQNTELEIRNDGLQLFVASPEIGLVTNFGTIVPDSMVLEDIRLSEPEIKLELDQTMPGEGKLSAASRKIELKKFRLDKPMIGVRIHNKDGLTGLYAKGDTLMGTGMLYQQWDTSSQFSIKAFQSRLSTLSMDADDNEVFHTGKISLELSSFLKRRKEPVMLDLGGFDVGAVDVHNSWKNDTLEISTGGINLGVMRGLVLQKDSLIQAALKIPPTHILPSTFIFRTPEKKFSIQNIRVNTAQEYLEWDSLEVENRLSRDSFFARQPFEKDYFTFSTGKIRADALRPVLYGRDTAVYVRKLTIDPLHFKVERDKRMPDDTVSYRPLLTRMLRRINFPVSVDTIDLRNSLIWHNVIDEKTEKEGTIFFTNVDGYLLNVKNYDIKPMDSIRINLSSDLMGVADLRFQYREAYNDPEQGFLMSARMGAMEMKELNRLMLPLFSVRADRGKIRDLAMRVKGNDSLAYGSMEMNYNNLRVSLLNEENKRRDLVSWFANLFVRGKNNKTGIIYTERLREKSIFNFWARISVSGLLTNLGVKKNGKQVRKFYKGLDKSQLPEDLF